MYVYDNITDFRVMHFCCSFITIGDIYYAPKTLKQLTNSRVIKLL